MTDLHLSPSNNHPEFIACRGVKHVCISSSGLALLSHLFCVSFHTIFLNCSYFLVILVLVPSMTIDVSSVLSVMRESTIFLHYNTKLSKSSTLVIVWAQLFWSIFLLIWFHVKLVLLYWLHLRYVDSSTILSQIVLQVMVWQLFSCTWFSSIFQLQKVEEQPGTLAQCIPTNDPGTITTFLKWKKR